MILDLKHLIEIEGESLQIDYSIDLLDYELFSTNPFIEPIIVKGRLFNRAGVLSLHYKMEFNFKTHCDRCNSIFERKFSYSFEHIIVPFDENQTDEYIYVVDNKIDVKELALSDLLVSLPSKILCGNDCKGLCFTCGVNLNDETCKCTKKEIDPRLMVLGQLL